MSSISAGTTTTTGYVVTSDTTGALVLKTGASGTTAVTIDTSQNVGIGTSSPASLWSGAYQLVVGSGSGGAGATIYTSNSTTGTLAFADGTAGDAAYRGYVQYAHTTDSLVLGTGGTTKATLDSSGNLGLGVTPSAWDSARAFQFGPYGGSLAGSTSQSGIYLNSNVYYGSGNWRYATTGTATQYKQNENSGYGSHVWLTAPSGTAGNAITFTQAMTLDSGGNLAIGSTVSTVDRVRIKASNTTGSGVYNYLNCTNEIDSDFYVYVSGTASTDKRALIGPTTNTALAFQTNSAERARIDGSGNFLIGATTSRGLLTVGPSVTSVATATPTTVDLGSTYSNTAGQNLKLKLWASSTFNIGLGVSAEQLDYVVNDNGVGNQSHNWYTTPGGVTTPTKRMQLNASGALTVPNQPMFSAVHTATESPTAGGTLVQWSVYVLTNCGYSSGVFTAQVAGRYLICASLLQVAAGGIGGIYLRRNGVTLYRIFYCDDTTGYEMGSGQVIVSLAVNDTVSLNQESSGITWYGDGSGLGAWTINLLG